MDISGLIWKDFNDTPAGALVKVWIASWAVVTPADGTEASWWQCYISEHEQSSRTEPKAGS